MGKLRLGNTLLCEPLDGVGKTLLRVAEARNRPGPMHLAANSPLRRRFSAPSIGRVSAVPPRQSVACRNAWSGLRMMPTFQSRSLKFRTVDFPQYRLQGQPVRRDLSSRRATNRRRRHPTCSSACDPFVITLRTRPLSTARPGTASWPRESGLRAVAREASPLYPRGPWLRPKLCCLGPSRLTTTPSVSPAGTRRFHGLAVYTPRLRCAGAPWRPT